MIASQVERLERLQNGLTKKHLSKSIGIPKLETYLYLLEGFEKSTVPNINKMALESLVTQASHFGN